MPTSRFFGKALRHRGHKPWRMSHVPRENARGAIRGAAARERALHPSPAKAVQRRIRLRLVAAYIRRFGTDDFALKFSSARIAPLARSNWLPGGYAWWRERLFGRLPLRGA